MKAHTLLSLACAAALTVACSGTDRNETVTDTTTDSTIGAPGETLADRGIDSGERDFVEEIAIASAAEIELGKMAAQKASNPEVKKYGQMMVDDHTKAGEELKQIAQQYNIMVPAALDEEHRELRDELAQLSGREFDERYMEAMVDSHQNVVDKLQARVDERERGATGTSGVTRDNASGTSVQPEDADNHAEASLNMWAANTLPAVKAHLDHAKQLDEKIENSTGAATRR